MICGVPVTRTKAQHWFPLTISDRLTPRLREQGAVLCDTETLRNEFCELLVTYKTQCCVLYGLISVLYNYACNKVDYMALTGREMSE
jgi:hypothetical protein